MSRLQYIVVMLSGLVLLVVSPVLQLVLVWFAKEVVTDVPELEYLFIPYSAAAIGAVACLQVVLVVVMLLLRRIYRGLFYEPGTLRLIDVLTISLGLAGTIPVFVIQHLHWTENINPFMLMLLAWILIFLTPAAVIVLRTLRGIYVKAAADHHELEQVI